MSFRLKTILGVAAIEAVLLAILVWSSLDYLHQSNQEGLIKRAESTAALFASTTTDAVLTSDLAMLDSFVAEVLDIPGLVYARVLDQDGRVLVMGGNRDALGKPFVPDDHVEDLNDGVFDAFAHITVAGETYGRVEIGLGTAEYERTIAQATRWMSGVALTEMILVALFSFALGLYLTHQLGALRQGARRVAGGDLGHQIQVRGSDELAETAAAFNNMSSTIHDLYEELRASEERFRDFTTSASDWFWETDDNLRFTFVSENVAESIGAGVADMAGKRPWEVPNPLASGQRSEWRSLAVNMEAKRPFRDFEFLTLGPDGKDRWINVSGKPAFDDNETFIGYRGTGTDVTPRRQAEERMKDLLTRLETSNTELKQFAYVASHDLQEPLRMVTSYLQLLEIKKGDALGEDARDYIGYAVEGAQRMRSLIRDLLAFSRVEQTGQKPVPTNAKQALDKAIDHLDQVIVETDGKVTFDELPRVLADEGQLVSLFQNLVGNGLKYHRETEPPHVHVSAYPTPGGWEFIVTDNGIGIDPQYFEKIFLIFQRLHTRDSYPGTGIGLAVCKKIIERHGGQIWVESEEGSGCRFHFTLSAP